VVKKRFKILTIATEFSVDTQVHLVPAIMGLYNFIRQYEGIDVSDNDDDDTNDAGNDEPLARAFRVSDNDTMKVFRDQLTAEMWKDYQEYITVE
jgi:hypothetical protein